MTSKQRAQVSCASGSLAEWSAFVGAGRIVAMVLLLVLTAGGRAADDRPAPASLNQAARQYLGLIEHFAGFAEQHWNEKTQSYDAKGAGVTWARGNGGVALVNAVLLTELPDQATFSPRRIPRHVLFDHTQRAIRSLSLTSRVCTDPRATRPGTWGGHDARRGTWHWQAALETEHWIMKPAAPAGFGCRARASRGRLKWKASRASRGVEKTATC